VCLERTIETKALTRSDAVPAGVGLGREIGIVGIAITVHVDADHLAAGQNRGAAIGIIEAEAAIAGGVGNRFIGGGHGAGCRIRVRQIDLGMTPKRGSRPSPRQASSPLTDGFHFLALSPYDPSTAAAPTGPA
jgi:hypothetical protein